MKKKALITGITGQIGSYLAELLSEKGYEVYGIVRGKLDRKQEAIERVNGYAIFEGDLEHPVSIERIIKKVEPDEIYNLAAQSDAIISSNLPAYTFRINAEAVLAMCEILRKTNKPTKFFQASSAELFKGFDGKIVDENAPFIPNNPYGIAKLAAYWGVRHYRERYGVYASNGLFFNSESPRRGENFVTRKITKGIADIIAGKHEILKIGSLDAKRDWSHAKDTAAAAWSILQAEKAGDYIVASGEIHSVREFIETAFKQIGVELIWRGEGLDEVGHDKNGRVYVSVDAAYFRPHESKSFMVGDSTKLRKETGWKPTYNFETLVKEMITKDLTKI